MDPDLIKKYLMKLQTDPSIVNWAEIFAIRTWQKIGFCRSIAGFNMHENTVTQELIYLFWELADSRKLPVQMYQAKNEKANGNDIEIAIQTSNGYLLFPCQAKIVNKKGSYPGISHKIAGRFQSDRLLEYSRRVAGVPLYLFYNCGIDPEKNETLECMHSLDIQRLGCSIFPAEFIKKNFYRIAKSRWSIPNFYSAHYLLAIPFSCLFELVNSDTLPRLDLKAFSSGARFYSKDDITDKKYWRNLTPPPSIGRITTDELSPLLTQALDSGRNAFNPAFRIICSIERETTTLVRWY
jgi:hypothetical protein